MKLKENINKFIDAISIFRGKIPLDNVRVRRTPQGNWDVYYKGSRLGVVNKSELSDSDARDHDLISNDPRRDSESLKEAEVKNAEVDKTLPEPNALNDSDNVKQMNKDANYDTGILSIKERISKMKSGFASKDESPLKESYPSDFGDIVTGIIGKGKNRTKDQIFRLIKNDKKLLDEFEVSDSQIRQAIEDSMTIFGESLKEELDKKKLIDYIVKGGQNINSATKMVNKQFDYVNRVYGNQNLSIRKAADIITSLGLESLSEKIKTLKEELGYKDFSSKQKKGADKYSDSSSSDMQKLQVMLI